MGKKVIIDTNNFISALGWEGKSRELLRKVMGKEYDLYISVKQIREIKRVMNYPKFKFTEKQKKRFLKILFSIATIIDTKTKLDIVEDRDDNMLLECAVEANADYIISGDKHIKKLKQYKGVRIISVSDLIKL